MFGGHGLYAGKQFFGILYRAQLYFATNSQTARAYLARGMQPFRPNARQTLADACLTTNPRAVCEADVTAILRAAMFNDVQTGQRLDVV